MSFGPLFIQPTNSLAIWLGGKSLPEIQEIQEIALEIGMLGKYGLDINDPQETHVLRALPGRTFLARELVCFYYIGSAEGLEYSDLQVGDEVNPRTLFVLT
jgi:hypothetical protein